MKPAFVQNLSFRAVYPELAEGLRSSFRSLFNKSVAVYPEQNEGSHSYTAHPCPSFYSRFTQTTAIKVKKSCFFLCCIVYCLPGFGQPDSSQSSTTFQLSKPYYTLSAHQKKQRQLLVGGINAATYGGSLFVLHRAWYKNEARTSFQVFNDTKEWLQIDKIGHGWTAYNAGRASTMLWEWAGLPHKKAVWMGGLSGFAYLTGIEFLDAHSAKWGWSWGDIGANIIGSSLFMGQEFLWKEQRVQYKFSFHKKEYNDPMLEERADELFGEGLYERMLKDYNAQTYWFSFNLKSFLPETNLPSWLNIAVGYGADGMFGGFENKWKNEMGTEITRYDIPRKRQFYLAPDIDFTKIKTKSKFLRTSFELLNAFKCPAPALMIDSKGKFKAHAFYF